jgi:hypothetical protein
LERRLREEQALREAAQTKLKKLKKRGHGDKTGLDAEDDTPVQKGQRKTGPLDSSEHGVATSLEKTPIGGNTPSTIEAPTPQQQQQSFVASAKQKRGVTAQSELTNATTSEQNADVSMQMIAKLSQPLGRNSDVLPTDAKLPGRNVSQVEDRMGSPSTTPKATVQNGQALPLVSRQETTGTTENKVVTTAITVGQFTAPNSPVAHTINVPGISQQLASKPQEGIKSGSANGSSIERASAASAKSDCGLNASQPNQRSASNGPKIPASIDFDPLKCGPPVVPKVPLDANGRSTPVESHAVPSVHAASVNADFGLGGNVALTLQNQFQQPFDVPSASVGQPQTALPHVGISTGTGLMSYPNGVFSQGATVMLVSQQQYSQPLNEDQNGGLASNLSLIHQPYLQLSPEQQTVHSRQAGAEWTQPVILIQPQHVRGVSMHDFSVEPMLRNPMDGLPNVHYHSRGNSMQTFPNMNQTWSQNTQWVPVASTGMGQQQSSGHQADPFDELVTRRPLSTISQNGE